MPGRDHIRYNYLLLALFDCSISVVLSGLGIALTIPFEVQAVQDRIHPLMNHVTIHQNLTSIPLSQSRLTSRASTTRLRYQAHHLLVTTLPSPLLIK